MLIIFLGLAIVYAVIAINWNDKKEKMTKNDNK